MSDDATPPATQELITKIRVWPATYGLSAEDTTLLKAVCKALTDAKRPVASAPSGDQAFLTALFPEWQKFDSMEACVTATLTDLRRMQRSAAAAAPVSPVAVTPAMKPGGPDLITILYMQFLPRVVKAKRPMNMGLNGAPVSEKPNVAGYYRVCPDGTIERWERLKNKDQYISVGSFKIEGFDGEDEDDNPNAPRFTPAAARRLMRGDDD